MVHILLVIIYLAFISLGLPDSLLGSAWPVMHLKFCVPISWAGAVSMIIAAGTIVSSLFSDRLTRRLGAGRSQAIIGVQILGTCLMPPLCGVLANTLSVRFMPFYLLALLALMLATHEQLNRR